MRGRVGEGAKGDVRVMMEELSFEEAFERLQAAIQKLDEGGLTLEASIEQFELGMRLANLCTNMLDRAELRVSRLMAGEVEQQDNVTVMSNE